MNIFTNSVAALLSQYGNDNKPETDPLKSILKNTVSAINSASMFTSPETIKTEHLIVDKIAKNVNFDLSSSQEENYNTKEHSSCNMTNKISKLHNFNTDRHTKSTMFDVPSILSNLKYIILPTILMFMSVSSQACHISLKGIITILVIFHVILVLRTDKIIDNSSFR